MISRVAKYGEHILMSLALLATLMIALFFLLNLAAKRLPGVAGSTANTVAEYASGAAYGY